MWAANTDFIPTFLHAASINKPPHIKFDGISILNNLLKNEKNEKISKNEKNEMKIVQNYDVKSRGLEAINNHNLIQNDNKNSNSNNNHDNHMNPFLIYNRMTNNNMNENYNKNNNRKHHQHQQPNNDNKPSNNDHIIRNDNNNININHRLNNSNKVVYNADITTDNHHLARSRVFLWHKDTEKTPVDERYIYISIYICIYMSMYIYI
jgi:hypothetical protein